MQEILYRSKCFNDNNNISYIKILQILRQWYLTFYRVMLYHMLQYRNADTESYSTTPQLPALLPFPTTGETKIVPRSCREPLTPIHSWGFGSVHQLISPSISIGGVGWGASG